MPTFTATKSSGPEIEDGTYPAKFKGVEDSPDKGWGEGYRWLFAVTVEDEIIDLDKLTSQKMGPKSNNVQIINAIIGRQLEVNESVDPNDYKGNPVRVSIENPEEGGWPKIVKVLPPKKG